MQRLYNLTGMQRLYNPYKCNPPAIITRYFGRVHFSFGAGDNGETATYGLE